MKTSANVPAADQGVDAGKKIAGRKCRIGVDTPGLLLVVRVTAASLSDNAGGTEILSSIAASLATTRPHPHRSEAMAHVAMTDLRSRRLTEESTPNRRD